MNTIRHLYFHVPFCAHICPYCSFYKHQPGNLANAAFVKALLAEVRNRSGNFPIRPETIYFGGGTPTLLSRAHLDTLLSGLWDLLDLSALREWTFEANPSTFGAPKATLLKDAGVNRVSLGTQSWTPRTLAMLGRDHTPEAAREGFEVLRSVGFGSLNIDLMFSVPGQTLTDWEQDLEITAGLRPDHVSAYNLTYEEDTAFFERFVAGEFESDENADADHFHATVDRLAAAGLEQYEISNYARPGHESLHNQAYWRGGDYLGFGPGAVSTREFQRWKNVEDTARYVAGWLEEKEILTEQETLTEAQKRMEAIALRLRTRQGAPLSLFADYPSSTWEPLVEEGMLVQSGDSLFLTRRGKALADSVTAALV